jgi:serine/threonine-protein kinase
MSRPGDRIGGWLQLEHVLGRGGVGSVWRARDVFRDRHVAVKLLDARFAEVSDMRLRFEREATSAAALQTPHVVKVLGHGVDGSTAFLVMELLEGEDLASRLRRRKRLPLQEVVSLVRQVGHALEVAHAAGVIHRDLKPANVFLARTDEGEVVKVLDFGLAKVQGGTALGLTATGDLLGTIDTISPEQVVDPRGVDLRSDLWSLGVVAFMAATGHKPFASRSLADAILKIAKGPTPRATDVWPDAPLALDAFFEAALQRDRTKRFSSARDLVAAFENAVACSSPSFAPISSYPPPPPSDRDPDDDAKTTQMSAFVRIDSSPPVTRSTRPPPSFEPGPPNSVAPRPRPDSLVARAAVAFALTFMIALGVAPMVAGATHWGQSGLFVERAKPVPRARAFSGAVRRAAASCAWQAAARTSSASAPGGGAAAPPR